MGGNCEQLEIDTKDICLLCLESTVNTVMDSPHSSQGLKHLLRYLKVSPKQLFNCSSEFLQSMEIREDIDLKISLCSKCSSVTEKFNKLYQDYELIQLQFGDCVQSLHESISKGNENPERVRKYKDQMRPTKSTDLVNASIAANLRNETLKKCSLRIQSGTPRVRVTVEKSNADKCLKMPILNGIDCAVNSKDGKTELPRSFTCNAGKTKIIVTQHVLPQDDPTYKATSEQNRKVDSQAKSVKTNLSQRKSSLSSIRMKLKKSHPIDTTAFSTLSPSTKGQRFDPSNFKVCEYCAATCTSKTLHPHTLRVHPERIISKYLPSHISLELCRQGIREVWRQQVEVSGNKCQFCQKPVALQTNLKRHMISSHAEEFAVRVLENIQSLSLPKLTNAILPTETGSNVDEIESKKESSKSGFCCEYCNCTCTSRMSLKNHRLCAHPEHIVHKYFPSHIPLDSCKQGVDAVLEQLCQQTSDSGFKCKYCTTNIVQRTNFKLHLVSMHAEQIAVEAQHCLGLNEQLEVLPTDSLACSSTWRTREYESNHNPNDGNQMYGSVEMDVDIGEEKFIKIENPLPESVDLDPLDGDYLD